MSAVVIDKDFGVIIVDHNTPIYKYYGNYYIFIDDQYLTFKPDGDQDSITYTILTQAPVPPYGNKIDYSKSATMLGITSILFVQAGNTDQEINPDLEKAQEFPADMNILPSPVDAPVVAEVAPSPMAAPEATEPAVPPMSDIAPILDLMPEATEAQAAPAAAEMPADQPPMPADGIEGLNADDIDGQEVMELKEDDLDEFLKMFAVGEVTKVETVRGVQVQTFDVNLTSVKNLLGKTDSEFLNDVQNQFLINMQKIADLRLKNQTVGQFILNVKGLPNWIVPVVNGSLTAVQQANSDVKPDSFQSHTSEHSCNFKLDPVNTPMYTGYSMDTDKPEGLPGYWRKSRSDYTVNVAMTATSNRGPYLRLIKLPGNSYETDIKLTDAAINRIANANNRNKSASMYARIITAPKTIRSIDVDLIGTERVANVTGLIIRAPGSSSKSLSLTATNDKFIELKCSKSTVHQTEIEKALTAAYPSVDQLITNWGNNTSASGNGLNSVFKILEQFQYDRADITKSHWSQIGEIIKSNIKTRADEDWASKHTQLIGKLTSKRTQSVENKEMTPADNGKYNLKSRLNDYLNDIKDIDTTQPNVDPAEPVALSVNNPRYNSIMMDPVHGLVFRSDETGKFYTVAGYRQQLRYQLIKRIKTNLKNAEEDQAQSMSVETLKLIQSDLETYRWTANKGMLDSLKIKLSTSNTVASATLNLLSQFDLSDITGQVSYIRHMTMFINQGFIRLDPSTKKYYIVQTQERVCCQHEFEDLKEQSLADFIGKEGKCKYCGAQIVHLDQPDDYGQTQFMTTREMYTAGGSDDATDSDPDFATLSHFIDHAIEHAIKQQLTDRGIALTNANKQQIKEDTMAFIKANNLTAAKPYGSIISTKPFGGSTPDLRLAIMYSLPIKMQKSGEDDKKAERTAFKPTSTPKKFAATTAFSRALAYFKELEADSTTDPVPELVMKNYRAFSSLSELLSKETSFSHLFNMIVLNRLCYCYGVLVAHMNLTVNMDYSNTDKLINLMDEQTIYSMCNTFNTRMTMVLNQHIKNLHTSSKEEQDKIMPYFEAYIRLFSTEFNRELFNIGMTSQTPDGVVITVDQRSMLTYERVFDTLVRQNAEMYDQIKSHEIGFAKYEANYSMVAPITASTPRMPGEIKDMPSYMDCWAVNMRAGTTYGDRLWRQYATINKMLSQVPYGSEKTVGQYLMKVSETSDDRSVEAATFQASVCSSTVLLNGSILEEEPDNVMEEYLENEKTLSDFKKSVTDESAFDQIDQAFCEFNLAVPNFNKSLQTNLTYHPCNPTPKGAIDAELIAQKHDIDETVRAEYQNDTFLNNMRVLVDYKKMDGYAQALDQSIFNKRVSSSRLNFLTNDIEAASVNNGPVKTITNSEYHTLVANRRFTVGLSDSLLMPENADEIPGFNDDFPTLIKSESQLLEESKQTITRRRIFRIQNNGRAIKTLIGWMSTELNQTTYETLKKLQAESEASSRGSSSRYMIEKVLASMEGYNLIDLIHLKWNMRNNISGMKLDKYVPVMPEIYTMSFVEYSKIMDQLNMPDEKNLSSFRDLIFAAIRMDIIVHVKRLRLGSSLAKKLNRDWLDDIHDFDVTTDGMNFINMVTQMLNALAKINIDPNVDSLNKLYEARQMERIKITMAARHKANTGFDMSKKVTDQSAEQLTGENDPDLEHPEEDADADNDGQDDDDEPIEGDDGEDEFDDAELAGMVEGDVEVRDE